MATKTATVISEGDGLRFVATVGSGHTIVLDDGNGDTGMRPTELLPVALAALLAGWFRSRALGLAWPDSVALQSPADLGISPEEYRATTALLDQPDLERNRLLMTPGPAGLEPVLARIASALQAHRLAGPIPPPGSLLDPGLLPAAP